MIGGIAYRYDHPDKLKMILLNNILGGPAMSSRLNLNIRENTALHIQLNLNTMHIPMLAISPSISEWTLIQKKKQYALFSKSWTN